MAEVRCPECGARMRLDPTRMLVDSAGVPSQACGNCGAARRLRQFDAQRPALR